MSSAGSSTYHSLVKSLYEVGMGSGVKLGLENMRRLKRVLGDPDQLYDVIHVAGTNGKGSVVTMIAKALELSGKKVGLYTSPHLSSFRERICINGWKIPHESVERLLPRVMQAAKQHQISATFFELMTALALLYFADQGVEIAVLETGLGGRFDATNVVLPKLSVITSISLDHTAILGNSLEEIAKEKAGIIKKGIPVILGPRAAHLGIELIAEQQKAPCNIVEGQFSDFLHENQAVARQSLLQLQLLIHLPQEVIDEGLSSLPPCRFQIVPLEQVHCMGFKPPRVILDVAHNPDGLRALFEAVHRRYPAQRFRVVAGFSEGKDLRSCLKMLSQKTEHLHLIHVNHHRILPVDMVEPIAEAVGIKIAAPSGDCREVLPGILKQAGSAGEIVVICGSCFVMHDARLALGWQVEQDAFELNERPSAAPLQ